MEPIAECLQELPQKRRSLVKYMGVPDRWLVAYDGDTTVEHILVGEIKPAHVFHGVKVSRVLSTPPGDDFFLRTSKEDSVSTTGQVSGDVYIATAICQTFHYMITAGLEFGYVAAGDSLVFLRVREDDPNTLYYFWSLFPVPRNQAAVVPARQPRETAMAHMATLCILSIQSSRRSASWIDARNRDLQRHRSN